MDNQCGVQAKQTELEQIKQELTIRVAGLNERINEFRGIVNKLKGARVCNDNCKQACEPGEGLLYDIKQQVIRFDSLNNEIDIVLKDLRELI